MRFPERTAFALFLLPGISVFAQTLTPATTISAPSARFSASPKLSGTQGLLGVVAASGSTLSSNLVNAATGALSGAEVLDGPFSLVASDPAGRFVYVAAGTTLFGGTIDSGNGV